MEATEKIIARVAKDYSNEKEGKFIVQPLKRGYATTLGNAMRRMLLTSVPGSAITSLRVDGVLHEFSTIPGVREDVSEIILNLKETKIQLNETDSTSLTIKVKGEGQITAEDIDKETNDITVMNPEHVICNTNEKADFELDLTAATGTSWNKAEENETLDYPIGTIFIDSIFSPIERVTFNVDNLPGTKRGEELERLTLFIETDGSVTPEDAMDYASQLLQKYFSIFSTIQSQPVDYKRRDESEEKRKKRKLLKKNVDEMELSVRAHNCLSANEIKTIGDLVQRTENEMLEFKNFGRKSLQELQDKLNELELEFGMDINEYISEDEQ
ncbi:MAG: DNA-directed RNA polymerase subunit alpha [Candidatus Marinimicrobia bacterium]|nr:DNA-directed RNA polymerase subunit alpha [Candidatus Neomarinimicrobiota bacterium]